MPVACVIPVRNGGPYLSQALDSVAAQTRPVDEVILVDDGSTDGAVEEARQHPLSPRIIPSEGSGPGHARNTGVRASRSDIIAFLDADDLWHPEKTAIQYPCFADAGRADLVYAAHENFADPSLPVTGATDWRAPRIGTVTGFMQLSAAMIRRSFFEAIGGFDGDIRPFGEDNDLLIRALSAGGNIVRTDEVLARRRLHDRNVTRALDKDSLIDVGVDLLARHLKRKRGL